MFLLLITYNLQELTDSENSDDEDSGDESGLGHTHSGSSGDEGLSLAHSQLQNKAKRTKNPVKTDIEQDSSNSIEILANKIKQTNVAIQPVGEKGRILFLKI